MEEEREKMRVFGESKKLQRRRENGERRKQDDCVMKRGEGEGERKR